MRSSFIAAYPRPATPLRTPTCPTHALLPLEPPPPCADPPALPRPRTRTLRALDASFSVSTHLVPAAFPRSTPDAALPAPPVWTKDRREWAQAVVGKVDEIIETKQRQLGAGADAAPSRAPLWVCVNRYRRKGAGARVERDWEPGGVTLFFAHATGYTKEVRARPSLLCSQPCAHALARTAQIWEPVISRLLASDSQQSQCSVDEIWSWEAVSHGDSAMVNGPKLGGVCKHADAPFSLPLLLSIISMQVC